MSFGSEDETTMQLRLYNLKSYPVTDLDRNSSMVKAIPLERVFDPDQIRIWCKQVMPHMTVCAVLYLIFVYLGPKVMQNRKPFDLRRPLIIWNWLLAIFSIAGFSRMAPNLLYLVFIEPGGYDKSVCDREMFTEVEVFWSFAFAISKLFEFVDTVFIVLRKAPLIFLHWYHHVSMLLFMFYLMPIGDPVGRWNVTVNFGVHSIMYTYYALRMSHVKIPRGISQALTTIQMLQFVSCIVATFRAIYISLFTSRACSLSTDMVAAQFIGGFSYLALFANFFIQTYLKNKAKKQKSS